MRNSFIDILNSPVEIPIIQRDYAQGRTDLKVNKIRKDFLDAIFDFIQNKQVHPEAELELDFIYGLNRNSITFIPIDGQQRLTTLWLLYWFVSVKEKVPDNEKQFLKNFVYETRHSTTQFCRSLVLFEPAFLHDSLSEEIKNQSWYFETWNYDPGIQAMLVMLDDIEQRVSVFKEGGLWQLIGKKDSPFYFYKLDMDKVGLTDDLYIKMNSRGKALTEFEYFKAGFSDLLTDAGRKEVFEKSIDGVWIDFVWHIVFHENAEDDDIALVADDAFLNLFNFITAVLSFKSDIKTTDGEYYQDTESTPELLKLIYSAKANQDFLFDTLNAVCSFYESNPSFWNDTFYYAKTEFDTKKVRLYFQHGANNLLNRCLFHYGGHRSFSFPEQILLLACFTHFRINDSDFHQRIRVVRNLVVNSENELRETSLGRNFDEVEKFMSDGNLDHFTSFKTDQIEEEKLKEAHLLSINSDTAILRQLEDSDIFRGSITLIPLDKQFNIRSGKFLTLFDEDEMISRYTEISNVLLCFGDYSQDEGELTNLMSKSKRYIRSFLTTPAYNKEQLYTKTQRVVLACLDFFISNTDVSPQQKIEQVLNEFNSKAKGWEYYFLKYPSFREKCLYGYYSWNEHKYPLWKMSKQRFSGYHWDPFLHEVFLTDESGKLAMGNYGKDDNLIAQKSKVKIQVSSLPEGTGFKFTNGNITVDKNSILVDLEERGLITETHELLIDQNTEGYDKEDRIEKLKSVLGQIIR